MPMNLGLTLIDDSAPPGGAEHDPAEAAAFAIHPPRTRAGLNPLKRDEFLNGLSAIRRACLALGRASGQTCLQLLDLQQIRYRFGRRWTPLRPKIFGIVESSLQRDLGRDDAYVAVSETLFYVFRIGLKRQDAERRGWLAAADITERLCGAIPGGVAVTLKTVPFDVGAGLAGVTSLEQLRNRVEAFSRSVDDAELRVFLDHAAQLQPWFRPTINLRKRLISAYHLEPVLQGPADSRRPLSALCPASLNGIFDAEADNWSIQQVGRLLSAPGARRQRASIIVPVHYETLATMRLREPFLLLCRQLPPASTRHLVLEILGLPSGMPQSRVRELMSYLRPFCLTLVARLPHDVLYAEHLANSGITGLSLRPDRLDPEAPAAAETLHMLVDAARAQRMRSLLVDARSVHLCHAALRAGVDQLNGEAFMPAVRQPGRAILVNRAAGGRPA